MDLKLRNKTAFISGSTKGIGFGIAKKLLEEGAKVIINGRNPESVETALRDLHSLGHTSSVSGISADFSNADDVEKLANELPQLDILVNNVGLYEPKAFEDITDDDWYKAFGINVMSGVRLSRHVLPQMLKRNQGRIIFISSESAIFIPGEMLHYGVTKTAILAVSRGLAELTINTGVTVNTILPGPTKTEGTIDFLNELAKTDRITPEQAEKEFFKTKRPSSLIQRHALVEEVANTVVYFASPLSSATNGAVIRVEGGILRSVV